MNSCRRVSIFLSLVAFIAALALVGTALATEYWFLSHPSRELQSPAEVGVMASNLVHSGLFAGTRIVDWGFGSREQRFSVSEETQTGVGFMTKGLWVCVVLFCALALLWITVGIVFSLINTVIRPVDTVAGPIGIYLWSGLAWLCCCAACAFYLVQYFLTIQQSVLLQEQIDGGFSSEGHTRLSYSFWLVVCACAVLVLPAALLFSSGIKCSRPEETVEAEVYPTNEKGMFMY